MRSGQPAPMGAAGTLRRKTRDTIKRAGRAVIGVFGEDSMPFAYTIGNHGKGMPEIVLVGLCDENAMGLLNLASEIQNRRGRPARRRRGGVAGRGRQVCGQVHRRVQYPYPGRIHDPGRAVLGAAGLRGAAVADAGQARAVPR